jgi:hypothetical protein
MPSSFRSPQEEKPTTKESCPAFKAERFRFEIQAAEISTLHPADRLIVEAAVAQHSVRQRCCCSACEAEDHPIARGSTITLVEFLGERARFSIEGIGTVIFPADESDVYFIKLRATGRVKRALVLPDYQHNVARWLFVTNKHLSASRLASTSPDPTTGTTGDAA